MKGTFVPVAFAGALDDPCAQAIIAALPAGSPCWECSDTVPSQWPAPGVEWLILQRQSLSPGDADSLARQRSRGEVKRLVLCSGPHLRYRELEPARELFDVILAEATAQDVVGRYVGHPALPPTPASGSVSVICPLHDLRAFLARACEEGGYAVEPVRHWAEAAGTSPAVWVVPVLEKSWPEILRAESRNRPVLAAIGLADRENVATARSAGAVACVDLPCHPSDLVFALTRAIDAWQGCIPSA